MLWVFYYVHYDFFSEKLNYYEIYKIWTSAFIQHVLTAPYYAS